ncbi:hypothetical protein NS334_08550 [Sphingomonas endophytica]|uniref:Uncharacterized protein n=1 Tax=Sphingomonas endophytica TaxID=869719 RepID=A0A147I3I9_9SPHN|nr:hypothetical protein NS334_08550 [Sphingomonas endophytica]
MQVLAIIVERIARSGVSPCYEEIGRLMVPPISKTRVKQHVDKLVYFDRVLDREAGAQRASRIRDLDRCREMIENELGERGWFHARPLGPLIAPAPCTIEQLPVIPPFEHLPGPD